MSGLPNATGILVPPWFMLKIPPENARSIVGLFSLRVPKSVTSISPSLGMVVVVFLGTSTIDFKLLLIIVCGFWNPITGLLSTSDPV